MHMSAYICVCTQISMYKRTVYGYACFHVCTLIGQGLPSSSLMSAITEMHKSFLTVPGIDWIKQNRSKLITLMSVNLMIILINKIQWYDRWEADTMAVIMRITKLFLYRFCLAHFFIWIFIKNIINKFFSTIYSYENLCGISTNLSQNQPFGKWLRFGIQM